MTLVVIGVFDGVHRGHQEILGRAKELANGEKIIALTFDPHPTTVFAPERAPSLLTTLADRVELLKIHNADQVAVIKFRMARSAMLCTSLASWQPTCNKTLIQQGSRTILANHAVRDHQQRTNQ